MKLSAAWARVIVLLTGLLWSATLALRGVDVELSWLTLLGGVAGVIVVLVLFFDHYLWRTAAARWLARRRVLRGTWRGTLTSTWKDGDSGASPGPLEAYLAVDQTYSDVQMTLLTRESKSRSVTASFDDPARGQCVLSGIYLNTPDLLIQDRSRIHRGAIMLEVSGRPARRLAGFYFTDRDTKGELAFDGYASKLYDDFDEAQRATYR